MEAYEVRDEGMFLHQPDAPRIEGLNQCLEQRPRPIDQALLEWEPQMFCGHPTELNKTQGVLASGASIKKYGDAEVKGDSGAVPGYPGIGATPYQFRCTEQGEDELDTCWHDHLGTAVPAGVIDDQNLQTLVCWIKSCLEQAQDRTERGSIDGIEVQQIRSPGERMDKAVNVRPRKPIGVRWAVPHA